MSIDSNNLEQIIKDKCRKFLNKKSEAENFRPFQYFNDEILSRVIHWLGCESKLNRIICNFVEITEDTSIYVDDKSYEQIYIEIHLNGIEPEFGALLHV